MCQPLRKDSSSGCSLNLFQLETDATFTPLFFQGGSHRVTRQHPEPEVANDSIALFLSVRKGTLSRGRGGGGKGTGALPEARGPAGSWAAPGVSAHAEEGEAREEPGRKGALPGAGEGPRAHGGRERGAREGVSGCAGQAAGRPASGAGSGAGRRPLTRFSTVSTMSRLLTSPTWMSPMRTANFIRMLRIGTDGLIIPAGSTTEPAPDALGSPIATTPPPPPPPPPAPTEMSPAGCGSGPAADFSLAIYPPPLPAPAASPPGRAEPSIRRSRSRRGRREPARGAGTVPGAAPPLRYNEGLLWAPMPRYSRSPPAEAASPPRAGKSGSRRARPGRGERRVEPAEAGAIAAAAVVVEPNRRRSLRHVAAPCLR